MNNNDEVTVNIKSLSLFVLKKWKCVLVITVFIAVVFNAFYAIKNIGLSKDISVEDKIKDYESTLTSKELNSASQAYDTYVLYNDQYNDKMDYYKNSLKMKINSESVPTINLQYQVSDKGDSVNLDNAVSAYLKSLVDNDTCKTVADKVGNGMKSSYVPELITVSRANTITGSTMLQVNPDSAMVNITIIAQSKEQAETISQILKERVVGYTKELNNSLGGVSAELISDTYNEGVDTTIRDAQNKVAEQLVTLKTNTNKQVDALTGDVKDYYDLKYNVETTSESKSVISKKNIVLGIVAGLFVGILFYALKFILSKKMRDELDLVDSYYFTMYGQPVDNNNMEVQSDRIASEIIIHANNCKYKSILLTSTVEDLITDEVREKVSKIITENGINAVNVPSVVKNLDSYEKVTEVDAVVIVEKVMQSLYKDIDREIELCDRAGKKVMGAVVVK